MAATDFIIPESASTVDISIINSTARIRGVPTERFMEPKIKGYDVLDCPAYSFLIEHGRSGQKVLFDLGLRKDWENLSPTITTRIKEHGWSVTAEKGVVDILKDGGFEPKSINAIVWSHHHWDHIGDPSTFPHSTDLLVGPGFKDAFIPAYPTEPSSPIRESDYADRQLREISFDFDLTIGGYKALDYFGDGSFYLLDSPGFRPSHTLPLPSIITPSPLPHLYPTACPGSLFIPIHRLYDPSARTTATDLPTNQPFFLSTADGAHDLDQCRDSVRKMSAFDGKENVLVMIAHDAQMLDVVTCFPKGKANQWKAEGWKGKGAWQFLGDVEEAVKKKEEEGRG
ncbi:MAG: hypothetical protein Q9178_006891 [Gyalolechia marmorata]